MWVMGIWLLLAWFAPLLGASFVGVLYHNRHKYFTDMTHVNTFFGSMDGLFVFMILLSVIMLLLSVALVIFYLYAKYRYGQRVIIDRTLTHTTWFRITWLVVVTLMMIFISVASILQLACLDAETLRTRAIDVKFPPKDGMNKARRYAKYAFEMAKGKGVSATNDTTGATFLLDPDSIVLCTTNSDELHIYSKAFMMGKAASGYLRVDGEVVTDKNFAAKIKSDNSYMMAMTDEIFVLTTPTHSDVSTFDGNQSVAYNLAADQLTEDDIMENSLVTYIHDTDEVDNNPRNQAKLIADPLYKLGLSYAYLMLVSQTLAKKNLFEHMSHRLKLTDIVDAAGHCEGATMYANGLFFVTYIMFFSLICMIFIYKKCLRRKFERPYTYNQVNNGGGGDIAESEPIYDDPASSMWSQEPTSMNEEE